MRYAVLTFLTIFAVAILVAFPAHGEVLNQQDYQVTVQLPSGIAKVIITAPNSITARELAEAQYGKERVRGVVRIWKPKPKAAAKD